MFTWKFRKDLFGENRFLRMGPFFLNAMERSGFKQTTTGNLCINGVD
ncbi:hypothetical protein HanXRQr2_Chr11g0502491 [Helianthus annuus]|uniref:Uncharacterized protein n=1 Tax=Helianthus annuus TaxID=4232 RepID=A0A9K3HRL2_HELAN|nr:hypothetical protein HanXRQr2_Chr11g0502491 [Helianthus annuus]